MANIFIIHGAYGNPRENWIPWLKDALEERGHTVFAPIFPTPEGQTLKAWQEVFAPFKKDLNEQSIVVGHSVGVTFLLHLLGGGERRIHAAFFVASVMGELGNPEFDDLNRTFIDAPLEWERIRQNCAHFEVFFSENDPYVPLTQGEFLAHSLHVDPTLVAGAGHFNEAAGYTEFPLLLEKIEAATSPQSAP